MLVFLVEGLRLAEKGPRGDVSDLGFRVLGFGFN